MISTSAVITSTKPAFAEFFVRDAKLQSKTFGDIGRLKANNIYLINPKFLKKSSAFSNAFFWISGSGFGYPSSASPDGVKR